MSSAQLQEGFGPLTSNQGNQGAMDPAGGSAPKPRYRLALTIN